MSDSYSTFVGTLCYKSNLNASVIATVKIIYAYLAVLTVLYSLAKNSALRLGSLLFYICSAASIAAAGNSIRHLQK